MRTMTKHRAGASRARGVLAAVAAVVLLVGACGSSGADGGSPAGSTSAAGSATTSSAADSGGNSSPAVSAPASVSGASGSAAPSEATTPITGVPAKIASSGVVNVGSEVAYPPMEFLGADGTTPMGFDIDLFTAVADKLGVKARYENTKFDSILIGVQSGKYDVGVSSFTVNKERLAAVNMVTYLAVGTQWAAGKGNPSGVMPDSACGHKVAVQAATVQEADVRARSMVCTKAGKPAIDVLAEQDGQVPFNDVITGKAQAAVSDLVVVTDILDKTGGKLTKIGDSYGKAPFGFAVAKKDTAFAQAIATALNQLIADGTYTKLAQKWKVGDAAITTSQLNPAVTD